MKNFTKLFALAVVILGFSATSFGQSTQTGDARVKSSITAAQTITRVNDMDFAGIVQDGTGGNVTISPLDNSVLKPAGMLINGTPVAAVFNLTGSTTQAFNFSIPVDEVLTSVNPTGATPMKINNWKSIPASIAGDGSGSLVNSAGVIKVGATLVVGANQKPGLYESPTFNVRVDFQ